MGTVSSELQMKFAPLFQIDAFQNNIFLWLKEIKTYGHTKAKFLILCGLDSNPNT